MIVIRAESAPATSAGFSTPANSWLGLAALQGVDQNGD
jgi:hypothetical protein